MNIGVPPLQYKLLDDSHKISYTWAGYLNNLSTELISSFSDLGYVFPAQDSEKLSLLASSKKQSIIFNSGTKLMNVNNDGIYEPIATISSMPLVDIYETLSAKYIGKIFHDSTNQQLVVSFDGENLYSLNMTQIANPNTQEGN